MNAPRALRVHRASADAPWLLRDLLRRLMPPLLAIVLATGALGGFTAQRLTDRTFDRWLIDAARSLASQVRVVDGRATLDLPTAAEAILAYDDVDRTFFSVEQGARHVAGQANLPREGSRVSVYSNGTAFDAQYGGNHVRVALVVAGTGDDAPQVRVAETLIKRERARQELLLLLTPMAALLIAAGVAIIFALRMTLRPLEAIAARWNEQSHHSLEQIGVQGVPRELLPFANALNDLLARIATMVEREREFAANAAHQIRTPLAGLQLALARAADAPDVTSMRRELAELQHVAQRTGRVLQQLLALGRLDAVAGAAQTMALHDLTALAHDIGAAHMEAALAKSIDLELVSPPTPVPVRAHEELLSEALANLVDNAVRYTPAGGRILIEVTNEPPVVRVSDSGPGIAPRERQTVFERFVRGSATDEPGSGLGLAIVRQIADLHGASVMIEDSALGGVSVVMRFPRAAASAPA